MTTAPARARTVPHRRRLLLLGLVIPTVVAVIAAVIVRSWVPDLPDQVAVHWGPSGADGFASAAAAPWTVLIIVPVAAILVAVGWWWGQDGFTRRMALAADWFFTVFLTGLILTLLHAQRGLAGARDIGDANPWISLSLALALVAGVAGWLAMPGDAPIDPGAYLDPATQHLAVGAGEKVVWTRGVRQRGVVPVVGVAIGVIVGVMIATGSTTGLVIGLVVAALLLVLIGLFTSARVTVDATGLTVTLGPGLRIRTIAADQIADVKVVDVRPLRQFGGFGVRTGRDGTVGVVLRTGPGILTTMADGRRFVVTVDDAKTGAQVLAGVALRAQH